MKTFAQFVTEAYDKDVMGSSQIKKSGEGGRVGADRRKSEPEKRRMKAAGGGKMVPAKSYKDRKDIGQQRQASTREQQPEKERGSAEVKQSYADKVKAERKKAAQARIAAKKGGKPAPEKKETPTAKQLLSKKKKAAVNPNYKPQKASGKTRAERDKIRGEGEKYLKSVFKDQETAKYKKETGQNPDAKGRTKILGRVNKRMSN
tara:strand:- start:1088 stop:1699 length:612 start_codon:yes stop_codon:yes gene_type:complete